MNSAHADRPHLLREIFRAHQVLLTAFSRQVGVPAARLTVLRLLAVSKGDKLGVNEIGRRLGIDPAAVTRQVAEMVRRGLVARQPDPADKRRIILRLTGRGRRLFEQVHQRVHQLEGILEEKVGEAETATATRVLVVVRTTIEELAGGHP